MAITLHAILPNTFFKVLVLPIPDREASFLHTFRFWIFTSYEKEVHKICNHSKQQTTHLPNEIPSLHFLAPNNLCSTRTCLFIIITPAWGIQIKFLPVHKHFLIQFEAYPRL